MALRQRSCRASSCQLGVRQWLRNDRLALNVSAQRSGSGASRETGVVLALGSYYISF